MDQRANIAYLLADYGIPFTESKKGSSIHARSLIRAFERENARVTAYVLREGGGHPGDFRVKTIPHSELRRFWVKKMHEKGKWRNLTPWVKKGSPTPNWVIALSALAMQRDFYRYTSRKLLQRRPDFLYARCSWLAWPYVKLKKELGLPLVLEVNGVLSIEKTVRGEIAFPKKTEQIEKEMFHQADLILPVTALLKEQIVSFGVDPEKVVVTPNAVDPQLFHPPEQEPGTEDGQFLVGACNSMKPYHGMGGLVQAALLLRDKIPGLHFLLIGAGPQLNGLIGLTRELGIRHLFTFTGAIDHENVPELLRRCNVCVAPHEGEANQYNCPMKLYEYMSMKRPIIASEWGDVPNIIKEGETAWFHPAGDPQALADAIFRVYQQPEEARRRAENAFELVRPNTWNAIARRILDWADQQKNGKGGR